MSLGTGGGLARIAKNNGNSQRTSSHLRTHQWRRMQAPAQIRSPSPLPPSPRQVRGKTCAPAVTSCRAPAPRLRSRMSVQASRWCTTCFGLCASRCTQNAARQRGGPLQPRARRRRRAACGACTRAAAAAALLKLCAQQLSTWFIRTPVTESYSEGTKPTRHAALQTDPAQTCCLCPRPFVQQQLYLSSRPQARLDRCSAAQETCRSSRGVAGAPHRTEAFAPVASLEERDSSECVRRG